MPVIFMHQESQVNFVFFGGRKPKTFVSIFCSVLIQGQRIPPESFPNKKLLPVSLTGPVMKSASPV